MGRPRKKHTAEFKLKAVIEVLKGEKTAQQIGGEMGIHPVVLSDWKKQFMENGSQIFSKKELSKQGAEEREKAELFEQIGRLKVENEWLKKKLVSLS